MPHLLKEQVHVFLELLRVEVAVAKLGVAQLQQVLHGDAQQAAVTCLTDGGLSVKSILVEKELFAEAEAQVSEFFVGLHLALGWVVAE